MLVAKNRTALGFAVIACLSSFSVAAQTNLPRVTATGTTFGGLELSCTGSICSDALRSLETMMMMEREFDQIDDVVYVDKEQFCKLLEGAQPPDCSLTSPPSVPGYDPGFIGNGCGDGSFASQIANEVVSRNVWGYNGNLDYPLPGVSFYGTCQAHDYCYAAGISRATCDGQFATSLDGVCVSANDSYRSSCRSLATIYSGAVNLFGQSPYNGAQAALACAAWAYDMEANECDK